MTVARLIAVMVTLLTMTVVGLAVASSDSPYDRLATAVAPYMDADDALGFPMKVQSVAADPYKFWRGTKDLFFQRSRDHTRDWLDDRDAYVVTHGDLHFGNIGAYASAGRFGELGFGMVDFDDSARLPFQLELLQGVITLRLVAETNHITLTSNEKSSLTSELLGAYRSALSSRENAGALLRDEDDKGLRKLLAVDGKEPYSAELEQFIGADGRFRGEIRSGKGELKEILQRPPAERIDAIAKGIAEAFARDDTGRTPSRFRVTDANSVRAAVVDVVRRTRLGSSGSQGLHKYLVLMRRPIAGVDHDVIVYLKQQIPAAAERAGVVDRDARSPGERYVEEAAALTDLPILLSAWCDIPGKTRDRRESYWVTLKEPWSDEIDAAEVKDLPHLRRMARVWGVVAGAAHRRKVDAPRVLAKCDNPQLPAALDRRAGEYLAQIESDFAAFTADPRVARDRAKAASVSNPSRPR